MRNRYKEDLNELAWSNIYQRPDLQIRAILLMTKDNHRIFNLVPSTEIEKWKMIDAAYNSGPGSVKKRRTVCGLKKDCDPTIWKHNLEDTVVLSQKPIYGNRSPHFINNEHVEMIFDHRMHKYEPFF
jgi:membrane-bound lytic murein transglycosylase MltF